MSSNKGKSCKEKHAPTGGQGGLGNNTLKKGEEKHQSSSEFRKMQDNMKFYAEHKELVRRHDKR